MKRFDMTISKCRLLLAMLAAVCLSGCDDVFPEADDGSGFFLEETTKKEEAIRFIKTDFSPDYKTFCLTAEVAHDLGPYSLTDTSLVRVKVRETVNGIDVPSPARSRLTSIVNVEGDIIYKTKLKMLAVVDLTLPQEMIDMEYKNVIMASSSFTHDNLYLAFMYGDYLSETMPASDYVLENYFVHQDYDYKYLFRSVLDKHDEMVQRTGPWADAKAMLLVVMSDGKVYFDDDRPMDPLHYQLQEKLIETGKPADASLMVEYVNMASALNPNEDESVLTLFCNRHNGGYQPKFSWVDIRHQIDKMTGVEIVDNQFYFTNPDFKLYRGGTNKLSLDFYDAKTDSIFTTATAKIKLGSVYDPIIVNGHSLAYVVAQGCAIGLLLILFLYLIFQFLIPYIQYRQFLKRYVVSYSNPNMSVEGAMVGQSCYYCKAPYEEGDEVVVKCEHTMHKTCWDENRYHCPEYSDHCKKGHHYYNHVNRFDPHNAMFYMRWILAAIAAAIVAWACFTVGVYKLVGKLQMWLAYDVFSAANTPADLVEAFEGSGIDIYQLPSFGLTIGFFLTLAMCILTTWHRRIRFKTLVVLLRAVLASLGSFFAFLITSQILALIGATEYSAFFDWIPWTITGFLIVYAATYDTRIRAHKVMVFVAVVLGILSMYVWGFIFYGSMYDYRVLLLFSYIIFAVGLALCIASRAPHSNHYFLHVSGAIKEMDVALYKWFRNDEDGVVTIGRSIDCTLQLAWDPMGNIAPVQAELHRHGDVITLYAVEDGVFVKDNRPLPVGKPMKLYHGDSFQIGRTTFAYIEKDI